VVYRLEDSVDSGNPTATAHKLEQIYASQKDADFWKPGGTDDIHGNRISLLVCSAAVIGNSFFRAAKRPFIPTPTAAARYLVWGVRPKGAPYGVSRVWVGLSRLGAEPLLRRDAVGTLKSYRDTRI
jgi:hypothetical protein